MTTTTDTEEILVLYGSQTGNSESAAEQIHAAIPTKLLSKNGERSCTARLMHLDDFLEVEFGAPWTRLIIIVCSSYGVGQAPLGARKFREFCDEILTRHRNNDDGKAGGNDDTKISIPTLNGINFALLGLGDSHYKTYFKNPTTIHDALTLMGAKCVGEIGKADASGTGHMEQSKVIERWIDNIWSELDNVVISTPSLNPTDLDQVRKETWDFCLEIFPDWKKQHHSSAVMEKKKNYYLAVNIMVGIVLAVIARYSYEIVEVLKINVTGMQLQRISGILLLFLPLFLKLL
jgi:sulfite reductase alpha subunit-like flavoprotein